MTKLYEKNQLHFALLWIFLYILGFSLADSLSVRLGMEKLVTAVIGVGVCGYLAFWLHKQGLSRHFGLCPVDGSTKSYLWYLPLLIIISANLWFGITPNKVGIEAFLFVLSMLCVGFLEEIIFRGFLFRALAKDSVKSAIHISALTFGIGHIVNLLNGAELFSTLLQIGYAVSIGYLFTILFLKSGSLVPCIITHGLFNSLSVLAAEPAPAQASITAVVLMLLPMVYAMWIMIQHPDHALKFK